MSLSRSPVRSGRRQVQISNVTMSNFSVMMLITSATTYNQQRIGIEQELFRYITNWKKNYNKLTA